MQAMSALSGNTWNYYMHEWGPARSGNQKAIEEFEAWLRELGPGSATRAASDEPEGACRSS